MSNINNDFKKELVDKINSHSKKHRLVRSIYGHYYVKPMPSASELSKFYQRSYFKKARPDISSKGMDTGSQRKIERFHYDRQYDEVVRFIKNRFGGKDIRVLDVGCGMGELLKYLRQEGYTRLYGTELDGSFKCPKLNIFNGDFLDFKTGQYFDLVIFNNVLEHVREPQKFLRKAHSLLGQGGFVRVQVPNDLSYTQYCALQGRSNPRYYYISFLEHLHYFDFISMQRMLEDNGFALVEKTTNWPMDFFILMGLDYSKNPGLGKLCHKYRMRLEYKLKNEFLLKFYKSLAEIGIGRVVVEYGKKV